MQTEPIKAEQAASQQSSFKHLLIFILLFFAVWTVRATVLFFIDERIHSEVLSSVYSNAVKFLIWVVPAVIYLRQLDRQPALGYLKLTTPINKKGLVYTIIIIALYFAATIIFETRIGGKNLHAFVAASPPQGLMAHA